MEYEGIKRPIYFSIIIQSWTLVIEDYRWTITTLTKVIQIITEWTSRIQIITKWTSRTEIESTSRLGCVKGRDNSSLRASTGIKSIVSTLSHQSMHDRDRWARPHSIAKTPGEFRLVFCTQIVGTYVI
jgi:hypothetical protein